MKLAGQKIKKQILFLFTAMLLVSCNSGGVAGSGNITTLDVEVQNYNEIIVDATVNLIYEAIPGEGAFLKIEGDENLLSLLDISVKDSKLEIKQKKNINPTKMVIYTNSASLKSLISKGVADVEFANSIGGDDLLIEMKGVGSLNAPSIMFKNITINVAGVGDIKAGGSADHAKFSLSGKGYILADELITKTLDCEIKGAGDMAVNATEDLKVSIKGNGVVRYKGDPKISKNEIKGVGTIERM